MRGLDDEEGGGDTAARDTAAGRRQRGPARLRHRLPVRLRQHWRSTAVVCAALLALVLVFGEARVRPYVTSELVSRDAVTQNIEGEGDLFDGGEHTIEVSFDQTEYADMMSTFREEGEKEYIRADVTIDGTTVEDVGLRLKGNSTLMSLRGDSGAGAAPGQGGQQREETGTDTGTGDAGGVADGTTGAAADTRGEQGTGPGGGGAAGPGSVTLSEDEPENLPWLISFEEFVSGRAYQGHTEIALRPATATSDTALNEALALELTAAAGQTTQDYTFTSFAVNGGEGVPRLLLDAPDAAWADGYGDGVLYKGRAGGSFDYLGGDATDYEEAFNQINGEGAHDLQPVMDLLRFVAESDDEEFARELDEHLDTESFARYLALQSLMSNSDGMDGPGNNYYLWYDTAQERFTVLSWDLNLSFGGMGGMGGGGGAMPEGAQFPGGGTPPGGTWPPEGMEAPGGMPAPGEGEAVGGGMSMGGSGALKERFLADEGFHRLYEEAYADLYQDLVGSGTAAELLESAVSRAGATGDTGADAAGEQLAERIAAVSPAIE
ncbi:CotH kinase family protein [Nocardiopsis dassonvillei]|uniref:Spore coat protein CotH n=1 Tax=Nocardiopsis dassonvillei (strain ATCC 23218 / DSM 43111 / CIP 107115 / JCM 7437 / KCTC 9190 / NBRC 14626 / NCTC 10488 / NRRL B-5397 / IMRU 509) TaxID=446468 RepID=D7B5H8_NOCDD|nr:CotH kinase family protein [Nocardiopsis dassonvillei]ADH67245.1 Spore coat protein CotH [Nocardiopsis dassonvillei subsp. dassonvillei DSM 43111]NKY80727.1 spore coat protein CotH [Nocardiopsis dassonvillei]VEI87322.1 CotH protein [Nocardiopsis dassonvillei]